MSYHGKLQVLKNGTADAEIQLWAYQQLEKELTLTDEEIIALWNDMVDRQLLRKAQEQ